MARTSTPRSPVPVSRTSTTRLSRAPSSPLSRLLRTLPLRRARLTRSFSLVAPLVSLRSRSFFPTSSVARSSRRASTPMRLLPTVPPSRLVSSPARPPPPTPPTCSSSMSFLFPSVLPWRATSSPRSFPVAPLSPPSRRGPLPQSPSEFPSPFLSLPYSLLTLSQQPKHSSVPRFPG
jgi:hypothetical protein